MSFSSFSKEFSANMFTSVENQFITKYLPQASGDAVRVYLYGLYLCSCNADTDARAVAQLLKIPYERFLEIYDFWEECDLVHILSREPFLAEYLPVNAAVGKPKPLRPEKYGEFNRELLRRLSKAGKDFKPYEMQRILEFLENNPMEQQAFLLVAEYCIKKDGEKVSSAHLLNKAKKLCEAHKFTYAQVEEELSDYNKHERTLTKIFNLLGIYRKPQEADYAVLEGWLSRGMETDAVVACAAALKKGTLTGLDTLVSELLEKHATTEAGAEEYLRQRAERTDAVYKVARKLGVRVQNPRAYSENYVEKWLGYGYDGECLALLAGQAFKLGYGFEELDMTVEELHREGITGPDAVKAYCAEREKMIKLLHNVRSLCGAVKMSKGALDMLALWKSMEFSDAMILEAARRSVGASAPLSYMNKLLTDWKRSGISVPAAIPERSAGAPAKSYQSEAAIAADRRSERERYYSNLRRRAVDEAEKVEARANESEAYKKADSAVKRAEVKLAKAEVFSPEKVPELLSVLKEQRNARLLALAELGLTEKDLLPKFRCEKCSDTGFLPSGRPCDCYAPEN